MTLPGFPPAGDRQRQPAQSSAPPSTSRASQRDRPSASDTDRERHTDADRTSTRDTSTSTAARLAGRGARLIGATRTFTRTAARKIDAASRADGAEKTGLHTLTWSNCLSMAGDALVSVYLAATLFFAAPGEQQRGNVVLYLLVTVAPFAVIAPIIGPLLDRIDRGRRAALAATFGARAVLGYLLAVHTDSTVLLYICALLCLVFSRAYTVLKAAVVPRVLPENMALVRANSRMNTFGMVGAGVLGALGAGLIKLFNTLEPVQQGTKPGEFAEPTLGFTIELIVGALVFIVGAWVTMRLPKHVDTDAGEGKISMSSHGPDGSREKPSRGGVRIVLGTHVVTALRSSAVQKFLGGFLSFFMVFYIQATLTGFGALATLGALGAAAGLGSFIGTSIGTRFADASPDNLVLVASGVAVGCCLLAAITPGIAISIIVALIAAIASALGKIALDAIVQREIPDAFRSSAFSRSETVLQLSWVGGGTLGILLPTSKGTLWVGWTVAAVILSVAFGLIIYGRQKAHQEGPLEAAIRPRDPSESRFAVGRNIKLPRRIRLPRRRGSEQQAPSASPAGQADPDAQPSRRHRRPPAPSGASRPSDAGRPSSPGHSPDAGAPGPQYGRSRPEHGRPRPEYGRSRAEHGESHPGDGWLDTPAPYHQPTRALPDFGKAGLRPPVNDGRPHPSREERE